jgi:hypothetical protein
MANPPGCVWRLRLVRIRPDAAAPPRPLNCATLLRPPSSESLSDSLSLLLLEEEDDDELLNVPMGRCG